MLAALAAIGRRWIQSKNFGLHPFNWPAREGTLKVVSHFYIGNVLLGEICLSHGINNG